MLGRGRLEVCHHNKWDNIADLDLSQVTVWWEMVYLAVNNDDLSFHTPDRTYAMVSVVEGIVYGGSFIADARCERAQNRVLV